MEEDKTVEDETPEVVKQINRQEELQKLNQHNIQKRQVPNFGSLRSTVYNHFAWIDETRQWKCNYCSTSYNHSIKGGSASLSHHLENKHITLLQEKNQLNEFLKSKKSVASFFPVVAKPQKPKCETITEEGFKQRLINLIVDSDQAFRLVKRDSFVEYTNYLSQCNEKTVVPCNNTVKNWTDELFKKEKGKLKLELKENKGRISFIIDCWTSSSMFPFQGVIATWIDNNWTLCSSVIDLTILHGQHTGENLMEAFASVLDDYQLWEKLLAVTSDNATNMDSLFRQLESSCNEKMLDWNAKDNRVRCLAHIVNLACKAIIKEVIGKPQKRPLHANDSESEEENEDSGNDTGWSFLEKIRRSVAAIRNSSQRREKFKLFCNRNNIQHKSLILDVDTRWNSTVMMLKRVLEYKLPFLETVQNLRLFKFNLDEEDIWDNVKLMIEVLQPFEEATTMLSQGHSPTLSDTAAVYHFLFESIERYTDGNERRLLSTRSQSAAQTPPDWLKTAATKGWEKLQKYYDSCESVVYVTATVLDPRYKMQWFKLVWQKPFADDALRKVTIAWNKYKQQAAASNEDSVSATTSASEVPSKANNIASLIADRMQEFHSHDDELKRYLKLGVANPKILPNGIDGALSWWKIHEAEFPNLSRMAKDFLAICATGVPVERLFSSGVDILRFRRQGLKAETIQSIMCLKQWLKRTGPKYMIDDFKHALQSKLGVVKQNEIELDDDDGMV